MLCTTPTLSCLVGSAPCFLESCTIICLTKLQRRTRSLGMRRHGCCLSRVRDYSHLFTGSPSLPDKYRHSREMMMLLPAHRDRPSSAMYPAAIMENGQVADLISFMAVQPSETVTLFLLVLTTLKLPCSLLESMTTYLGSFSEATQNFTYSPCLVVK